MSAGQYIDYEALALAAMQDAHRGLVRAVLTKVGSSGLAGEHHFYIAFNTQAPGVVISKRLKEKYPQEMTIVLQHRFWDLEVTDERFSVKLTFDGIPERLVVPFKALKVFYDPSVPFGLQFEESEMAAAVAARRKAVPGPGQDLMAPENRPSTERAKQLRRPRPDKTLDDASSEEAGPSPVPLPRTLAPVTPTRDAAMAAEAPDDRQSAQAAAADSQAAVSALPKPEGSEAAASDEAGAKVVDFAKFRNPKK